MTNHLTTLFSLLPRGDIYPKQGDGTNLEDLLAGIADSLDAFEATAFAELLESFPDQTGKYLEDWEALLGLPFPGAPAQTVQERRDVVVALLTTWPESSPAFFEWIASVFGYTITISRGIWNLFQAGTSQAGDQINSPALHYVWDVAVNSAGPDEGLEYVINFFKPAHTFVTFTYNP